MIRTATVTDVTGEGVWVQSMWLTVPTGPLPIVGHASAGDLVVVSRSDDGELIVIAGGAETSTGPQPVSYTHVQVSPSATWTVTHNLGWRPAVTVVDSAGTTVFCGVEHPDVNTTVLRFTGACGGHAYLS